MRIVAHNGAQIWGGAERATVALLWGLKARGHSVTLLCNADVVARNANAYGLETELCVIGGDIALHHSMRLAMTLKRLRPDAFIIGTFKKLFLAGLGARMAGVPRVVARIGLETDTPRSAKYRYALRHWIDGVAVNARRMVRPFAELDGFEAKDVALIWNGVEPAEDEASDVRSELGIPQEAFVAGTVGRLAKQKRIDRLIQAIDILPDVRCIIAGDGARKGDLAALVSDLRLGDRVILAGHRDDTDAVLASLDVFVVSSDTEGLSNAMLEAMSRGVPVVSTDVSGAEDALTPGNHAPAGIVVDFTPEALARGIALLRDDRARRQAMGDAARDLASTVFSMDAMLDKWEAFVAKRGG
jgi:glycosyltransferase involved in cell wall biosynthesis